MSCDLDAPMYLYHRTTAARPSTARSAMTTAAAKVTPYPPRTSAEASLDLLLFSPPPATASFSQWGQQVIGGDGGSITDSSSPLSSASSSSSSSSPQPQAKYALMGRDCNRSRRGDMDDDFDRAQGTLVRGATSVPISIPTPSLVFKGWNNQESDAKEADGNVSGLGAQYAGGLKTSRDSSFAFVFQLDDVPRNSNSAKSSGNEHTGAAEHTAKDTATIPSQWYSTVRIGWADTSPSSGVAKFTGADDADGHQEAKVPHISMARRRRFNLRRFNVTARNRARSSRSGGSNDDDDEALFSSFRQTLPSAAVGMKELDASWGCIEGS
jgi:hypothetical protein